MSGDQNSLALVLSLILHGVDFKTVFAHKELCIDFIALMR